jgi:hypothetical protein
MSKSIITRRENKPPHVIVFEKDTSYKCTGCNRLFTSRYVYHHAKACDGIKSPAKWKALKYRAKVKGRQTNGKFATKPQQASTTEEAVEVDSDEDGFEYDFYSDEACILAVNELLALDKGKEVKDIKEYPNEPLLEFGSNEEDDYEAGSEHTKFEGKQSKAKFIRMIRELVNEKVKFRAFTHVTSLQVGVLKAFLIHYGCQFNQSDEDRIDWTSCQLIISYGSLFLRNHKDVTAGYLVKVNGNAAIQVYFSGKVSQLLNTSIKDDQPPIETPMRCDKKSTSHCLFKRGDFVFIDCEVEHHVVVTGGLRFCISLNCK